MAAEKSPAFQFYPKDFLCDGNVSGMSLQERGAYITLLCFCWQETSLPTDTVRLARLVGSPHQAFLRFWPAVKACFLEVDGRLVHPRLEAEREKQATFRQRQSDRGKASAAARLVQPRFNHGSTKDLVQRHGQPNLNSPISDLHTPVKEREKSASLSPAAPLKEAKKDPFTDDRITLRAGRFIERYQALYPEHRQGALYASRPMRDYAAAVTLCQTWPDDTRLEKLAICFLTTNHRFAEEGSRTIPQFLALASWCDGELAQWEAKHKQTAS